MAIFRKIHTSFWSDSFTSDLDRDKKLFYLYLLTNERTTQCGIYEITKKQISFDLGYSIDTVCKLLEYFMKIGKIKYNDTTKEIAIKNWAKYNNSTSPKVQSCINKELAMIKDRVLIEYIYSMDTETQEEQEKEQEKEQDNENEFFETFWNLYNKKVGSKEKCMNKFKKLKELEIQKIFETLPNFISQFKDKQFQPFPETYLNNKRWNDELQQEKPQQPQKRGMHEGKYYKEFDENSPHYLPYLNKNNIKFNQELFDKWNYGNNL